MTGSLVAASWRAMAQPPLVIPAVVAALVAMATVPFLDNGFAERALWGVATLLACGLASCADDPVTEVAAASPNPRWLRCATRLLIGLWLVLPVAALSLTLRELQVDATPISRVAVEMFAILMIGPTVGFAVWAWGDVAQPAYAAMAGTVCCSLATWMLPASLAILKVQSWGPPADAVLIRWSALALLGAAIVAGAWREPAARRRY